VALTVFLVGVWFTTPPDVLEAARKKREEPESGDPTGEVPLAMR
jgi:hypothetical protein